MDSGREALQALQQLRPRFHPDPADVGGALENQFTGGPREVAGAGGTSYAIESGVLRYLAGLPATNWSSVETGCGYSTVVFAKVCATHWCVNPDLTSNRLVRDFVAEHLGTTGLEHVEQSSDQALPALAARGIQVELALIDGNHSHPFPILDFHYMDQMLVRGGLLLIDNTEIDAVQELTDYLELEPAYEIDRLIGNCAVYRKVGDRTFGWRSQVLPRSADGSAVARRELARLRMDVAPELRAALTGMPVPLAAAVAVAEVSRSSPPTAAAPPAAAAPRTATPRVPAEPESGSPIARQLAGLVRWYRSPSGMLAGAALLLLGVGITLPGPWRLVGAVGALLLAVFLPYRFHREQRRTDVRISKTADARRAETDRRFLATSQTLELAERQRGELEERLGELDIRVQVIDRRLDGESADVEGVAERLSALEARLTPMRRFAVSRLEPARRELTLGAATDALLQRGDGGKQ